MAGEKTITIRIDGKGLGVEMQGFINKAEGLAVLLASAKTVQVDLFKEVMAKQDEILKGMVDHGFCSCPACEAKAAVNSH